MADMTRAQLINMARQLFLGVFVGTLISLLVQGYNFSLMITYCQSQPPLFERLVMVILFTLCLFTSCIEMYQVYEIGVKHFMNLSYLLTPKWPEGATMIVGAVCNAVSQGFFATRLSQLLNLAWPIRATVFAIIGANVAPHMGLGVHLAVTSRADFSRFMDTIKPWELVHYGSSLAVTLLLSVASARTLWYQSLGKQTRRVTVFETVSFYSVHAMVLPVVCSFTGLVLRSTLSDSTIHTFADYCLTKVSVMVLLQMLIDRHRVRPDIDPSLEKSLDMDRSSPCPLTSSKSHVRHQDDLDHHTAASERGFDDLSRKDTSDKRSEDEETITEGGGGGSGGGGGGGDQSRGSSGPNVSRTNSRNEVGSLEAGRYKVHEVEYAKDVLPTFQMR